MFPPTLQGGTAPQRPFRPPLRLLGCSGRRRRRFQHALCPQQPVHHGWPRHLHGLASLHPHQHHALRQLGPAPRVWTRPNTGQRPLCYGNLDTFLHDVATTPSTARSPTPHTSRAPQPSIPPLGPRPCRGPAPGLTAVTGVPPHPPPSSPGGLGPHGRDLLLFLILFFYDKEPVSITDPQRKPGRPGRAKPAVSPHRPPPEALRGTGVGPC